MPCPRRIDCPPDEPNSNYSAEGIDRLDFIGIVFPPEPPWPIDRVWTAYGCIGVYTSYISQEDADLGALRQAILCPPPGDNPPEPVFYTSEQRCSVTCPDGTLFTYVVPAGMFVGQSQAEVDAQAYSYACQQANLQRLCLGNIPRCFCIAETVSIRILAEGVSRALAFSVVAGSLPPGMTLDTSVHADMKTHITGASSAPGTFTFTIRAVDAQGSFAERTYIIWILEITTTVLPSFSIGVPYSFQLQGFGGSGNYAWRIVSGTLPTGLTMSLSGLISGTPTAGTTTSIRFEMIDTDCTTADKNFFPPHVAMATVATTRVATVIGYSAFSPIPPNFQGAWDFLVDYVTNDTVIENGIYYRAIADSGGAFPPLWPNYWEVLPPKKYKKLTWSGTSEQTAACLGALGGIDYSGYNCARAKYEWIGSAEIDVHGHQLSLYQKLFYQACPTATDWPRNIVLPNTTHLYHLKGYCWPTDPDSCSTCEDPPELTGDVQSNSTIDTSDFASNNDPANVIDQTHFGSHSTAGGLVLLEGTSNFPVAHINDVSGSWVMVHATHDYDGLLENEYTDLEAYNNAVVFSNSGNTAENTPRTTGYVSRFTSVLFTLAFSNLIAGEDYTARVRFWNTKTGASTFRTYTFTAGSSTHLIADTVPTPNPGQPLQVRDPSVAFL